MTDTQLKYMAKHLLGTKIEKSAALIAGVSTKDMFTVTGGRVCVTALVGEVITADIGANASNLTVNSDPTVGLTGVIGAAVAMASAVVGTTFSLTGNPGDAIVKNTGVALTCTSPVIIPVGAITLATSGTNTGSMKWTIWYYPVDPDGYVTVT
jgi:hypothetical protein